MPGKVSTGDDIQAPMTMRLMLELAGLRDFQRASDGMICWAEYPHHQMLLPGKRQISRTGEQPACDAVAEPKPSVQAEHPSKAHG